MPDRRLKLRHITNHRVVRIAPLHPETDMRGSDDLAACHTVHEPKVKRVLDCRIFVGVECLHHGTPCDPREGIHGLHLGAGEFLDDRVDATPMHKRVTDGLECGEDLAGIRSFWGDLRDHLPNRVTRIFPMDRVLFTVFAIQRGLTLRARRWNFRVIVQNLGGDFQGEPEVRELLL